MRRNSHAVQHEASLLALPSFQRAFRGDHGGDFEQIAVPHMTALYNQAVFLTKNSDDAKDLLQETYFKAYRFWDKFEKGTNIRGWLYQIMKNCYINHYRKRSREPKSVEFNENLSDHLPAKETLTWSHNTGEKAPHEVFEDEIACSLESLPKDYRTVVMMSDMEDFTYDEIANAIAVPIGTVRSRLHRGRRLLRERLRNYARENGYLL